MRNRNSSGVVCEMASCSSPTKKVKSESTTGPNWLDLPIEVTTNIFQRLDTIEIVTGPSQVCSLWLKICQDPLLWRTIDMSDNPCLDYFGFGYLQKICHYAVNRSCGNLEELNVLDFMSDELLTYITDRESGLRRIRLSKCLKLSDKCLRKVLRNLPLLEEVDISYVLTKASLEVIGQCCPSLKFLKFSRRFSRFYKCDDEAFAIAKTMPNLRRLKMIGNRLTNAGLHAILNGCPKLRSLDLRYCLHLDLSGNLGNICRKRMSYLRLPTSYHVDDSCDSDIYDSAESDIDGSVESDDIDGSAESATDDSAESDIDGSVESDIYDSAESDYNYSDSES